MIQRGPLVPVPNWQKGQIRATFGLNDLFSWRSLRLDDRLLRAVVSQVINRVLARDASADRILVPGRAGASGVTGGTRPCQGGLAPVFNKVIDCSLRIL